MAFALYVAKLARERLGCMGFGPRQYALAEGMGRGYSELKR